MTSSTAPWSTSGAVEAPAGPALRAPVAGRPLVGDRGLVWRGSARAGLAARMAADWPAGDVIRERGISVY